MCTVFKFLCFTSDCEFILSPLNRLCAVRLERLQETVLVLEVHGLDHGGDVGVDGQELLVLEGGDLWHVVVTTLTIN